jgi:ribosome-binding protein aMBF1 (putative translation factor)
MRTETCQNCGRIIGKLEQAYIYQNHIVCNQCYSTLTSKAVSSDTNNDKNEKKFVQQEQKSTSQISRVSSKRQNEIITNVKQGAYL